MYIDKFNIYTKHFTKHDTLPCRKCVYVLKYYCDGFICIINMHIDRRNQDNARSEDIIMSPLIRNHTDSSLYIWSIVLVIL